MRCVFDQRTTGADFETSTKMTEEPKKLNIMWDASQVDMFSLCEERFRLRYILNKTLPTKAKQLDRGSLLHAGYEVYYKELQAGSKHYNALEQCLKKIEKDGFESDLSPSEAGEVYDVAKENLPHWEMEDQGFLIKAVEEPFIYLLHEDDEFRLYMTGKIDLLVDWNTSNYFYENLPIDHKTYDRKFPLHKKSNQFINYSYVTQSNQIRVNRVGFQKTLSVEEKHVRQFLNYDDLFREQWKQNMIKTARRYIMCMAEQQFSMNWTSCDKWNRQCEYTALCESSGKEAWFYKLSADYVDAEIWDVTKILNREK